MSAQNVAPFHSFTGNFEGDIFLSFTFGAAAEFLQSLIVSLLALYFGILPSVDRERVGEIYDG